MKSFSTSLTKCIRNNLKDIRVSKHKAEFPQREEIIPVGRFAGESGISYSQDIFLDQTAFKTLNNYEQDIKKRWIDGDVIDTFILLQIKEWNDVSYVNTTSTFIIIGNGSNVLYEKILENIRKKIEYRSNFNLILLPENELKNFILMPYLKSDHWRLLVLNQALESATVLDPYEGKTVQEAEECKLAIDKIKKFGRICTAGTVLNKLSNINWTVRLYKGERAYQKDAYNCGVFNMYHMYCIARREPMNEHFCPKTYRKCIAQMNITNSLEMRDTCLYCFDVNRQMQVMCKFCRRFAHRNCIPGKKRSNKEWSKEEVEFVCQLCAITIPDWMKKE